MASQGASSSQGVNANKHTLLTKSLHARAGVTGQVNQTSQSLGVASLSPQQVSYQFCRIIMRNGYNVNHKFKCKQFENLSIENIKK